MAKATKFSFPKSARLRDEEIFRELLHSRQKISTPYFSLRYINNSLGYPRLGIVPPKKKFAA